MFAAKKKQDLDTKTKRERKKERKKEEEEEEEEDLSKLQATHIVFAISLDRLKVKTQNR